MKFFKFLLLFIFLFTVTATSFAKEGFIATDETLALLKKDLLEGNVKIGQARLKQIRDAYGAAPEIRNSEKTIVYIYPDLRLEFSKNRYWINWKYDSFKSAAYSDKIDELRYDLESKELVGDLLTYQKFLKDYEEPTEMQQTENDGEKSFYYYGNIELEFENVFLLKSWKGQNLVDPNSDIFKTKEKE